MNKPIVRETHARTVLIKSRIPGVRYAINPYGGCSHACQYCYATFMERYHAMGETWGTYVNVKVNAPEILERDLAGMRSERRGTVLLSSVCDPYLPEEGKYRLTRRLLAMLLAKDLPVSILTKGSYGLITRDLDLFKGFSSIQVGLTITGLPEPDRALWEPRASPHSERIRTLKKLKDEGIETWAFVGPILPGMFNPEKVFSDLEGLADHVLVDRLNFKAMTWTRLEPFLKKHYPKLLPLYNDLKRGDHTIWNDVMMNIRKYSKKANIRVV
ncbi:radical SAM protein [Candidatus Pacearchaeota archaeon]|nr:radical SAM protein [Candidatus Pacearchaeota archaeon]